jgi:hypothetical protein
MNRFKKIKHEETQTKIIESLTEDSPSFVSKLRIIKPPKIHSTTNNNIEINNNNETNSKK